MKSINFQWMPKPSGFSFPLLKHVILEVLSLLLMGLALASSRCGLEPSGTATDRYGESFLQLFTEDTPVVTPSSANLCTTS